VASLHYPSRVVESACQNNGTYYTHRTSQSADHLSYGDGVAGVQKHVATRVRVVLLAIAALYYAANVWRISLVIDGTRYFLLTDDVMISMCYGRTLADVGQLAWYPSGPGGGFSSILWVCIAALAWKLWPVVAKTALLIQVFNGMVYILTVSYVTRAAERLGNCRAGIIAAILTITCWPVANMFAQGWEFSLIALALVAGYYYWLRREWWAVAAALALIGLTRFPLPTNTMAVKLTGYPWPLMVTRGAFVEFVDLTDRGLPLLFLIAVAMRRRRDLARWLLLGIFIGAVLLSIAVGGDAWHNWMGGSRIVISTLPLLAVLGSLAVVDITRSFGRLLTWMVVVALCMTWVDPARTFLMDSESEHKWYRDVTQGAVWVNDHTEPGTRIAVAAAGIVPWVSRQRVYVDILGLNDATIARMPAHRAPKGYDPLIFFYPGHRKYDLAWTAEHYMPDVILHLPQAFRDVKHGYHPVSRTGDGENLILVRDDTKKVWP
jgi:hypothetical protein